MAFEAPDLVGLFGLVRAGLGLAVLPQVMEDIAPRGVVARAIDDAPTRNLTLATWQRPASAPVERFLAMLRKRARQ